MLPYRHSQPSTQELLFFPGPQSISHWAVNTHMNCLLCILTSTGLFVKHSTNAPMLSLLLLYHKSSYYIDQVPLYSEVTELFRKHCASIKCQDMGGRYFPISQKKAHTKMRDYKHNYGEETLFFKT